MRGGASGGGMICGQNMYMIDWKNAYLENMYTHKMRIAFQAAVTARVLRGGGAWGARVMEEEKNSFCKMVQYSIYNHSSYLRA